MIKNTVAKSTLVLVVGRSPVNRIVVTRVVERMGLKAIARSPEQAIEAIEESRPGIVVLDGGATNGDCERLLHDMKEARDAPLPGIIFLSTTSGGDSVSSFADMMDAVIAKPVTIERLQPAIEALR